jgi:hypothetical protein
MSKKTSQNTREILISEVQTKPSLWDVTHPGYKNCEKNKKIWAEIGKNRWIDWYYTFYNIL